MRPDEPMPGFLVVDFSSQKPVNLAMQRLLLTAGFSLWVRGLWCSMNSPPGEKAGRGRVRIYASALRRHTAAFRIWGKGFAAHSELKAAKEALKTYEGDGGWIRSRRLRAHTKTAL